MQRVGVHDVVDAEAFVIASMRKVHLDPGMLRQRGELEDTISTGLLILFELASRYKCRLDGYEQDGCFSGYAARYLPARIMDAYWDGHENVTTAVVDGRKRRVVHPAPVTLAPVEHVDDEETANAAEDRALAVMDPPNLLLDLHAMPAPLIPTSATADRHADDILPASVQRSILVALSGPMASEAHFTVRVAGLRALDLDRGQIAQRLGSSEVEVGMAITRLNRISRSLVA